MSLLADLVDDEETVTPADRLRAVRADLEAAKAECARLGKLHKERLEARSKVEALDMEAQSTRAEAQSLAKRIEAEERRKGTTVGAAAEQQRSRWVDPANTQMDPEAHSRAVENLRKRRTALQKLLAALKDPQAVFREEDALRQLEAQKKALERAQTSQMRELALCSKQVEGRRHQMQVERGANGLQPDLGEEERAEKDEEYLRRLQAMLSSTQASREKMGGLCDRLNAEWSGWFELLSSSARRLDAKSDADASLPRLAEGETTTPAFKVLELVRDLSARAAELRKRASGSAAGEAALELKLKAMQSNISAQGLALKLDGARQRAARAVNTKLPAAPAPAPGLEQLS
jgi:hypothetical protein